MKTVFTHICVAGILAAAVSAAAAAEAPVRPVLDSIITEQTLPAPPKPEGRPSVAVILSGGGAKGFAHVPLLEMLEEEHIPVDMVIGVSAGSIVASLYATGHSTAQILDAMRQFGHTSSYTDKPVSPFENNLGDRSTGTTPVTIPFNIGSGDTVYSLAGLISGQRQYDLFKELTLRIPSDVDYDTLPVPLRTISTNLLTGQLDIRSSGDIAEAVRCSVSVPSVFQPFYVDGNYYIDGGTLDNTPIDVAVKMGYDIIIVSDIGEHIKEDPSKFQSSIIMPLTQWTRMGQSARVQNNRQFATLYINPDVAGAGMLSFTKTEKIYKAAKKSLEQYRQTLKDLYAKDFAGAAAADGRTKSFPDVYNNNKHLRVSHLKVTGAIDNDEFYINLAFKGIKDKELTEDDYLKFSRILYHAGKYNTVVSRITGTEGDYTLDLLLRPVEPQKGVILIGGTYAGTMGYSSKSDFSLSADVQWRGLTGYGSLVSAHVSAVDGFSGGLTFRHRFTGGMFVQLDSDYTDSFTMIRPGMKNTISYVYSVKDFSTYLRTGYSFLTDSQLIMGSAGIRLFDTGDVLEGIGGKSSAAEFNLSYTSNLIDRICFPHKGFYLQTGCTGVVPITYYESAHFFDKSELDVTAAIPLGSRFTFVTGGYAGADFTQNLLDVKAIAPIYSFSPADRRFFPQIAEAFSYCTCMGAASASFCYSPESGLDMLGMKLSLGVSGAVGKASRRIDSISDSSLIWRSSFDVGVGITNAFCAILRLGAGTTVDYSILPFVSFDVGKIRL